MRLRLRIGTNDDLSNIYNLHLKCFSGGDVWYKSIMGQYIDNSLVVESCDTGKLLGCLFQGNITPANLNEVSTKVDDFEFIDSDFTNYIDLNKLYPAILLVCVDPDYRSKGIGRKLIQAHINSNKDKGIICLHTRLSNSRSQELYKKLDYIPVGIVKKNCILPTEDSLFMIKILSII